MYKVLLTLVLLLSACQPAAPDVLPTLVMYPTPTIAVTPFGVGGRVMMGAVARSCPRLYCDRIAAYQGEEFILLNAVDGDLTEMTNVWYEVRRGEETFYIHHGSVQVLHPVPTRDPRAPLYGTNTTYASQPDYYSSVYVQEQILDRPTRFTNNQPASQSSSCPSTCSQMTSCAQVRACMSQVSGLDGDGDGIPCENVCD